MHYVARKTVPGNVFASQLITYSNAETNTPIHEISSFFEYRPVGHCPLWSQPMLMSILFVRYAVEVG
jgi:hypothetical protein